MEEYDQYRSIYWLSPYAALSLVIGYKAGSAGQEFRKVDPAYTSQACSSWGTPAEDALVRPDVPVSVLRDGKDPEPQRLPEHFETRSGVSGSAPRKPPD
ncbi:MAG: zinc ribbon domain-containing protein [Leptospirales bacterium]